MPFRVCPVCRNFNESKIVTLGELTPTFNFKKNEIPIFKLVECQVCTTIYQTPLPSNEILHEIYVDNDQFTSETYIGDRAKIVVDHYKHCAKNMMSIMQKENNVKVLEIGSGLSWMCRAIKELNSDSNTIAQDISPECKDICSWVDNYIVGSCEENYGLLKRLSPFDIISLTHVIEHLSYPVDFLLQIANLLGDRGIIFITAPYQPVEWKTSNNNMDVWESWSYNHVPAHLQYLTEESIKVISKITNLTILSYNNSDDEGQAFELLLSKEKL